MTAPTPHKAKQPQPVLTRAGVVAAIHILAALCIKLGAGNVSTWLGQNSNAIAFVVLAAAPVVLGYLARRHVTPTSSPRNNAGEKLEPSQPLIAAEGAKAENVYLGTATNALTSVVHIYQAASEAATSVDEALADADTVFPAPAAALENSLPDQSTKPADPAAPAAA